MSTWPRVFDVHICALDRECRFGRIRGAWRLEIHTPWWHLGIALTPGDRFVRVCPEGHYHFRWIDFTRAPR